jgi:hypothetical protein
MNKGIFIKLAGLLLAGAPHYAFTPTPFVSESVRDETEVLELFSTMDPPGLSFHAFALAFEGFRYLQDNQRISNDSILTIIDYSQASIRKRCYVFDIKNKQILENCLTAHGVNSGTLYAHQFSNSRQSHMSSPGFYITDETYEGKHGYSLKLCGIENGINDNAQSRAIVIHGAHYVSENFIRKYGRLGRSYGCPALPFEKNERIIDLIRNRSCLFIYSPDKEYLSGSEFAKFSAYLQADRL